ncbi:MAG: hypothetical protein COA44_03750 [Arcobacter sp.]|nr:MAG: hypothetical protein COA44_03750 [Arcobacter sp.]
MELNLLYIVPFSLFILILWVGGFLFMFLNIMRNDPREIEFRAHSSQDMGLLPKKLNRKGDVPVKREKKYYGSHPQFS